MVYFLVEGKCVFEGEKTIVFWILWMFTVWNGYGNRFNMIKYYVPFIVGSCVFVFIGFFMMKSGVKKPSGT